MVIGRCVPWEDPLDFFVDIDWRRRLRSSTQGKLGQERSRKGWVWVAPRAGGAGKGTLWKPSGQAVGLIDLGMTRPGKGPRNGQLPSRWEPGRKNRFKGRY